MGKTITFINEKGGVGKSSCCFNIAWELSKTKRVLIIDMDGQRANITFFCGVQKSDEMLTIFNVLQTGTDIRDTVVSVKENLDIVPANSTVSEIGRTAKISKMKKAVREVSSIYDYVFIDVSPTPNWSQALALSCSDHIIIPMLPDVTSLEANMGITESIIEIQETVNPELNVLGILFNKYDTRTNLSKEVSKATESMSKGLDTKVFDTKIRNAVVMSENVSAHVGVTEYDQKSPVSEDIRNIIKEIEREV